MHSPIKELDKALGIVNDIEPRIKAPDDYKRSPVMKMPAQELVDTGQVSPVVDMNQDIDNDYEYQRQNFYNLVERGNDAILEFLNWLRSRNTQGHTKLPATLSNKLRRLQKNLETYRRK